MDRLIYTEHPTVILATNTFVNVPIILQYEDTPLIQIIRHEAAGFTTSIPIYHADGTYLAKVVGSQVFATKDGEKAGITLEHPDQMTVCKLDGKIVFEMVRDGAAALKTQAELFTPEGFFVKCSDSPDPKLFDASGSQLDVGGMSFSGNRFSNCRIGIWIKKGSIEVGCG